MKISFADYKTRVNINNNEGDPEVMALLLNNQEDLLSRCRELHNSMGDAMRDPFKDSPSETDLSPEDSVSQVASCLGAMSTTSSKLLVRWIDLNCKHVELLAIYARDFVSVKADAAAADAYAKARLRIGETKLKAEEKYIALSVGGPSMAVSGRHKHKLRLNNVVTSGVPKTMDTCKTDLNRKCVNVNFCESVNVAAASGQPALAVSKTFNY